MNYKFPSEPTTNEITEYHNHKRFISQIYSDFGSFDTFIEVYTSNLYNRFVTGDESVNPLLKINDDVFIKIFNYISNPFTSSSPLCKSVWCTAYISRFWRDYAVFVYRFNKIMPIFVLKNSHIPSEVKRYIISSFLIKKSKKKNRRKS